jgi:hypothetical protein
MTSNSLQAHISRLAVPCLALSLGLSLSLVGCVANPPTPAVLTGTDTSELSRVISRMLNQRVSLTAFAFSDSSVLILEHQPIQSPQGVEGGSATALGRNMAAVEKFQLLIRGNHCLLGREPRPPTAAAGELVKLTDTHCRPISATSLQVEN